MPIVAKSVADARRAQAAAAQQAAIETASSSNGSAPSAEEGGPPAKPLKAKRAKKQPTGDYPVGYCRAPEETRFQDGCKPGPGRGKGNKSQDTIRRDLLKEKRDVSIGGKVVRRQTREALELIRMKKALSAEGPHLVAVLAEASRLFPDEVRKQQNEDESVNDNEVLALFAQFAGGKAFTPAPVMKIGSDEIVDDPDWNEGEEDGDAPVA